MFYETAKNDHGLRSNPYKSIIVPQLAGWIINLDPKGVANLARHSQSNNVGYHTPYLRFSSGPEFGEGGPEDSARNALITGEFVRNMPKWELRNQINTIAQMVPPDVDEADLVTLAMVPSHMVAPPWVEASLVHLECRYHASLTLPPIRSTTSSIWLSVKCSARIAVTTLSRRRARSISRTTASSRPWATSTTPRSRVFSRLRSVDQSSTRLNMDRKAVREVAKTKSSNRAIKKQAPIGSHLLSGKATLPHVQMHFVDSRGIARDG